MPIESRKTRESERRSQGLNNFIEREFGESMISVTKDWNASIADVKWEEVEKIKGNVAENLAMASERYTKENIMKSEKFNEKWNEAKVHFEELQKEYIEQYNQLKAQQNASSSITQTIASSLKKGLNFAVNHPILTVGAVLTAIAYNYYAEGASIQNSLAENNNHGIFVTNEEWKDTLKAINLTPTSSNKTVYEVLSGNSNVNKKIIEAFDKFQDTCPNLLTSMFDTQGKTDALNCMKKIKGFITQSINTSTVTSTITSNSTIANNSITTSEDIKRSGFNLNWESFGLGSLAGLFTGAVGYKAVQCVGSRLKDVNFQNTEYELPNTNNASKDRKSSTASTQSNDIVTSL